MHDLMVELYPICRSITGEGVRETLRVVGEHLPLQLHEAASGEQVFDWKIPREWNVRDAWICDSRGKRVVDFQNSPLHVLNYSRPVRQKLRLAELREHLFTLPDRPDRIPYRTSYYQENWGFCLTQKQLDSLDDDETYEVCIDSTLEDGSLTWGEVELAGEEPAEVLVSTHICHPAMANDNLSGIVLATWLARRLSERNHRYTYRFLFVPTTIGSLTWLNRNRDRAKSIQHGLVLACLGDSGSFCYKKSRRGDTEIDRAVQHVLRTSGAPFEIRDFSPDGGDERQFCSPGFDLPVGRLTRTPFWELDENHSSADDLELVRPSHLQESLERLLVVLDVLEQNRRYVNRSPWGEPQLGRRNLWSAIGGEPGDSGRAALLWVLNLSDGEHTLLDIAERSGLPFEAVREAASILRSADLLEKASQVGR